MPPKYYKRARAIAKQITASWGICAKQAYEMAWQEDAILIVAKAMYK